ncbi:MAG: hypothetical protein Q9170_004805 [Blastenia crenularia]
MSFPHVQDTDLTVSVPVLDGQPDATVSSSLYGESPTPATTVHDHPREEISAQDVPSDQPGIWSDEVPTEVTRDDTSPKFPTWSSPLPDTTPPGCIFRFQTDGEDSEFLSLFLATTRQVDIEFSKRHALFVFLMENLEKAYYWYARRVMPSQLEALQILSPDELEPHVWGAWLNAHFPSEPDRFGGALIGLLRHNTVHRYPVDTDIIKAVAEQAVKLHDDRFLEQIDLILTVLYCDVAPDEWSVTDKERQKAYDLLWPNNRAIESTHQLFDEVQNLGEKSSYEFCTIFLPQTLARSGRTVAEGLEITRWHELIREQREHVHLDTAKGSFVVDVSQKLQTYHVNTLRNAAAHRKMIFIDEGDALERYVECVATYVSILGDDQTASTIKQLTAETRAKLLERHKKWMDPAWCLSRDWKSLAPRLKKYIDYWSGRGYELFTAGVEIDNIVRMYCRSDSRLTHMLRENNLLQVLYPPHPPSISMNNTSSIDETGSQSESLSADENTPELCSSESDIADDGDNDWCNTLDNIQSDHNLSQQLAETSFHQTASADDGTAPTNDEQGHSWQEALPKDGKLGGDNPKW